MTGKAAGLQAIDSLTATVTVEQRNKGRMVVVEGSLDAAVTQTCVVTLEPLPRTVSERFSARLVTPDVLREAAIVDIDPASEQDDPEPIDGDSVDIGELAAQHLSLSLDPYPRAEGAELDAAALAPDDGPAAGPFAQLARLKPKP